MKNTHEVRGDVTAIFIKSNKFGEFEVMIDTNKLELVAGAVFSWYPRYHPRTRSFYAIGRPKQSIKRKELLLMHRLIMGMPEGEMVDHINHETLDNRVSNLRIANNQQNQQNRKGAQINSSSGVRGVHWHKHFGKWEVQIKIARKKKTIGYFDDIHEAEKAAVEARRLHMPFSNDSAS